MHFHVLLIEDNPGDVMLARAALAESGADCELHVVRDGLDALRFLRRQHEFSNVPAPSLVILDWNLPLRSGLEVLTEIRADAEMTRIPVVIHSGSARPADVRQAYDLHGNCWIRKSNNLDRYFHTLVEIVSFWSKTATLPPAAFSANAADAGPNSPAA